MFKKVPHTYVIIFFIIILAAVSTWFIDGGEYIEVLTENGTELVYQEVESQPQTWEIFAALFKGFEKQSGIIIFILMIGGAFWILNASKSVDVGIFSFLSFTRKLERWKVIQWLGVNNIIITLVMLLFSIFGAVFGMSEETIAFIIIIVPLAISMGYDSIVGVNMVFVAAGLGFAGAMLNPFTVGIAQGLSGLPLFSGFEYRMFCWLIINLVGITWVLQYARKIYRNPKLSLVYDDDEYWRSKESGVAKEETHRTTPIAWLVYTFLTLVIGYFAWQYPVSSMSIGNSSTQLPMLPISAILFTLLGFISLRKGVQFFILTILLLTIVFLVIGVMAYGWYIMEIASLFFAMGFFAGLAYGYRANELTKLFLEGVKDILSAALVVGFAGGIIVLLEDGKVIGSILHSLSSWMDGFGKTATIGIMYVIQTIINVVIPSGSAKAALTMPIMAPFSDLIGLSRQATVMAFQFGDGFTNMITPTSGVLIGVLGVARIPYDKWLKWITPFMIVLILLGFLLLLPTVYMDLNGF